MSRLLQRPDATFGVGAQAAEEAIVRMVEAEDALVEANNELQGAHSEVKRLRSHLTAAESKLKARSPPGTCSAACAEPGACASGACPC